MSPLENAGEGIRIFARPQIRRPGLEATPQPISGTVYAWRTPDWWSDTRFITSPSACLRNPVLYEQEEVRVELWNTAGTTLYDTEYTDSDGEYSLVPPSPGNYLVRATLGGQNWDVVYFADQVLGCATTTPSEPDPVDQELASVASGTTTADFYFGGTSSTYSSLAQPIADTNVHEAVRICMSFWRSVVPEGSPLNDEFMVWTDRPTIGAFFTRNSSTYSCPDTLSFGGPATSTEKVHYGSGTIAAHEFGHVVTDQLGIISYHSSGFILSPAFSEGYSDATSAVLLPDAAGSAPPTLIGPDALGDMCGSHLREPLATSPQYPGCFSEYPDITLSWYTNGTLQAALWIETREQLGPSEALALFSGWTVLATPPGIAITDCQPCWHPAGPPCPSCIACVPDEGAAPNTLHEVLLADDDNADLGDGTPHSGILCSVYAAQSVYLAIDLPICEESKSSMEWIPDCDRSGSLDIFDVLLFQSWIAYGSSHADINFDDVVNVQDWEDYLSIYVSHTSRRVK